MPASSAVKLCLWSLAIILLGFSNPSHASIFSVNNPKVIREGNSYVFSAQIDYRLTSQVIEALDNAVPITFFQELKLVESIPFLGHFWQWETTLWQSRQYYELRYHALSEQYVLKALDTNIQQNFPHLDGALQALGRIQDFSLPPEFTQQPDSLTLLIRSGLDLNSLPTPMRPGAMISRNWHLTSPWVKAVWP